MTASALSLTAVHKQFGRAEIIRGVDLAIAPGERHALIGPNGAGKSTLFDLISGRHAPTRGRIALRGRRISGLAPQRIRRLGLSRSFQVTNVFAHMSVFENLRCALLWARGYRYAFWRGLGRQHALNDETHAWLARLGLERWRDVPATALSYAGQRTLEIGTTVAGGAEVILLDEPTAGMSLQERDRAIALIREITQDRTLLIVEHDMGVVFDLADRISVLVQGRILASDVPAAIRGNAQVRAAYLGAS